MADTLTAMQEKFCQVYVETGIASEAYRQAYNAKNFKPESIHVNACQTLAIAKVSQRVSVLQAEHAKRHNVTLDSLTKELNDAKAFAKEHEQPAAVISAVMGKAKIHGFDKVIVDATVKTVVKIVDLSGNKT